MRRKIELIILVCVLGVMWVNVAMLGRDLKVRMVYGGGGTECGTGCICSNTIDRDYCDGYAHCDTINNGEGSWDYVYIDNLGTCDPKMGNYSFEQYCDWTCGGSGGSGSGTCGSFSQPSCGGGTCPNGKTCVGVGNQGLCGCSNTPSGGAGYVDYTCDPPTINGWACWEDHSSELWINAINTPGSPDYYRHQQTDISRDDVNIVCGNISGNHGFSLDFPPEWVDGVTRSVMIGAALNSDTPFGTELPGSPVAITCIPPPVNSAPTGTLTCPGSPMFLGQIASFTLNGSDEDGNLSKAGLYYSLTGNQSWNTINANIACTGGSCSPPTQIWTPIDT